MFHKLCTDTDGDIDGGVYLFKTSYLALHPSNSNFFIYTPSDDIKQMLKALKETSRISWDKSTSFEVILSKFIPEFEEAAASKGVRLNKANISYTLWSGLDAEVDDRPLPNDVCLNYLEKCHVPEVNSNWPYRFTGSEIFLAEQIKLNFGLGLLRKSDNKMLSSALHFHTGGIFVLYTDEECRGKGYAEVIVRNMVKEIKLRGRIPFATIRPENTASINLFQKVGFKEFNNVTY